MSLSALRRDKEVSSGLSEDVNFVGEDVLGEGEADGQVEPGQHLK